METRDEGFRKEWGRSEWNDALLSYYFHPRGGIRSPVTRITVTKKEIAAAAKADSSDDEVMECFAGCARLNDGCHSNRLR